MRTKPLDFPFGSDHVEITLFEVIPEDERPRVFYRASFKADVANDGARAGYLLVAALRRSSMRSRFRRFSLSAAKRDTVYLCPGCYPVSTPLYRAFLVVSIFCIKFLQLKRCKALIIQ